MTKITDSPFFGCQGETLIEFRGGELLPMKISDYPQWYEQILEEEATITEMGGCTYPDGLAAAGWRFADTWNSDWPSPCQCGYCDGKPLTVDVWEHDQTRLADISDAHNLLFRVAFAAADLTEFKRRFRQLDKDKFDELCAMKSYSGR
jgi:hypothetical protein